MSASVYRLVRTDNGSGYNVEEGQTVVIGRSADADIHIEDPTLSRRHAEIEATASKVTVRDLNSSNGTFFNGQRGQSSALRPGDSVRFGNVTFRLEKLAADPVEAVDRGPTFFDEAMIVTQRLVRQPGGVLNVGNSEGTAVIAAPAAALELTQRKLALLLEVSTALSRAVPIDKLLEQITDYVFQTMDVDRLSILMATESGELETRIARDRKGGETARVVPRSIARRVVQEKIAVVSANAGDDQRFSGESIVMQSVRSAMCAPLIGMGGNVMGVLYVDNLQATQRFDDEDLSFLVAFSGIAAVAIENSRYSERVKEQALTRSNFERFFTPALAARIAASGVQLKLGGEKRPVVVLFSDIRGFTALSERLPAEEMAVLLSEYFTVMVECVFKHGGTLDKFIGDAILAQWGAPVGQPDDADRALAAAFDMFDALGRLNAEWWAAGRQEIGIGIGLNAGDVFAGYIGSERRLEYTVLGDPVNVASRICGVAAAGEILVTESLLARLAAQPARMEERTGLTLKGKSQPVRVYSVASA